MKTKNQLTTARPADGRFTQNAAGDRLYLHMFSWPFKHIYCPGLGDKVAYAQLLNDGSEIAISDAEAMHHRLPEHAKNTLVLQIPVQKPPVAVPVIELFLKE